MSTLSTRAAGMIAASGCSMSELDALAGKTRGHFQAIVAGNVSNPTLDTVRAYCRVLGCSVAFLAEGEGAAPDDATIKTSVETARAKHAQAAA